MRRTRPARHQLFAFVPDSSPLPLGTYPSVGAAKRIAKQCRVELVRQGHDPATVEFRIVSCKRRRSARGRAPTYTAAELVALRAMFEEDTCPS